jgi:hypothetical protein
VRRLVVAASVVALVVAGVLALRAPDDDRPVDPSAAGAQRAIAVALEVVPGQVIGVARDSDDGKWEVTVRQDGHDFEVELHPHDVTLLGIDYD